MTACSHGTPKALKSVPVGICLDSVAVIYRFLGLQQEKPKPKFLQPPKRIHNQVSSSERV